MSDDDLRARLRHADPAASVAPPSPDEIARLVETTVTNVPVVRRRRHYALAAAALVLVAAGAGWALTRPATNQPTANQTTANQTAANRTAASEPATDGRDEPRTVRINAAAGIRAKCVEPSAERLAAAADLAFEGTVTRVENAVVTIDVSRVFHGAEADVVQVAQAGETSEQLTGSGRFEQGGRYLVASSEGTVMICGYSGEAGTPGLRDLYGRAFPG
ncbi:hypothetical protein [Actinoplanes sp. DH11]|uniref:hypothetical protein n=1 Tax=Actinoplanes sp. DH11 TaxID=2857011 RepID=UPI001E5D91F3|nr:hypothetical protein [Actinoplanes sp. DH11]